MPDQTPDPRDRRKMLRVPQSMMMCALQGKPLRAVNVPATAELIAVYQDFASRSFHFEIQDESFPPVPEGIALPHIDPTFKA